MANIGQHFYFIFIDIPGLSVESCNDFLPGRDAEFSIARIDLAPRSESGYPSWRAGELHYSLNREKRREQQLQDPTANGFEAIHEQDLSVGGMELGKGQR
jgi:hypothetical protein